MSVSFNANYHTMSHPFLSCVGPESIGSEDASRFIGRIPKLVIGVK